MIMNPGAFGVRPLAELLLSLDVDLADYRCVLLGQRVWRPADRMFLRNSLPLTSKRNEAR